MSVEQKDIIDGLLIEIGQKNETIATLQADNERKTRALEGLTEFASSVIQTECWAIEPLDGCDIQELAERLGLIAPHTATEADVDEESDFEVGDKIYKFTEALTQGKQN